MKKGRHRRFEEARKLKQAGPGAFDLGFGERTRSDSDEDDEYAALARSMASRLTTTTTTSRDVVCQRRSARITG